MTSALTGAYFILIGVLVVAMALFLLVFREQPLPKDSMPPFKLMTLLMTFWVNPIKHPDFAWAWLTRFLVYLSYYVALGYTLYFLQNVVHYSQLYPGRTDAQGVASFQTILTGTLLITALLGGFLSDRFQRRKIFVMGSSIVIACSFLILVFSHSWGAVLLSAAVLGLGFGSYLGIDIALITQVLPSAKDRGKDMGVINIANSLPQVVGVPFAAVVMTLSNNNYMVLFLVATGLALLSAALVQMIKGVR
jgi:MFS family permease